MRKLVGLKSAAICLALVAVASHAQAAFVLFNTGVDAGGTVLPNNTVGDPHYQLTSVPGGSTTAVLVRTSPASPIPPYIGDNTLSRWIGPNNAGDLSSPPGNYTYATTFDLTGFNPLTAIINGGWSSDNDGVAIKLNGTTVSGPTSFTQFSLGFAPFSITSGFIAGVNTLEFIVHNGGSEPGNNDGGANPSALRVEIASYSATAVPEASSFLVVGLGGIFAVGAASFGKRFGFTVKV